MWCWAYTRQLSHRRWIEAFLSSVMWKTPSLDGRDGWGGITESFKTCPPGKPSEQPENKQEIEVSTGLQQIKHSAEYYHMVDRMLHRVITCSTACLHSNIFFSDISNQDLAMSLARTYTTRSQRSWESTFLFKMGIKGITNMEDI